MKIPRDILEEKDILALEKRLGEKVNKDEDSITLVPHEWDVYCDMLMSEAKMTTEDKVKRMIALKAIAALQTMSKEVKTVEAKIARISAICSIVSLDPLIGRKLMALIKA